MQHGEAQKKKKTGVVYIISNKGETKLNSNIFSNNARNKKKNMYVRQNNALVL